jgi:hypothetical protein
VSSHTDNSDQLVDTLHLSHQQWEAIADKLYQDKPGGKKRRHERVAYRKLSQIALAVLRPDGEWGKYIVRSHDLSQGGMGFIHGSFLHIGTHCRVILKDSHRKVNCIDGVVRHCELIEGVAHNVGVEFDEEIDLDSFI